MKKILIPIILAVCAVMLVGCKRLELPVVGTIEITEYSTLGAGEIRTVTVRDAEQVRYICKNLNSLTLKEMGYNKPTERQFSLVFYNGAGMKVDTLSITAHGWIDYGGDFYFVKKGELDLDYIKCLLSVTAQNNNEKYSGSMSIDYQNVVCTDLTSELILGLLNNGEWIDDASNCGHDYTISVNGKTIRYHSECGTFINITDKRCMTLSDEDKKAVNEFLGKLFDHIDPSWE